MLYIQQYALNGHGGDEHIEAPSEAVFINFKILPNGSYAVFAKVDTASPLVSHTFRCVGSNELFVDAYTYIGSDSVGNGEFTHLLHLQGELL